MINEIRNLNKLISVQKRYITFLEDSINNYIPVLFAHGISDNERTMNIGDKLRKEIKDLEAVLGIKE